MKNFMDKLKRRITSKVFWATLLIGVVPLVAESLGYNLPGGYDGFVNTVLGVLVTAGLLHNPEPKESLDGTHIGR